jgi:triosephosphate isomerase
MKKAKKLVVGNWKMNPVSLEEARKISSGIKRVVKNLRRTEVVLCPPFVYLPMLSLSAKSIYLGAQNAHYGTEGAFTGEVSVSELPQFNVDYVIVGHSERRKMGETDEFINKKVKAVTSFSMTAIVCVGESTRDSNGDYFSFIKQQVLSALKDVNKKSLDKIVIAYEPLWAIGAKEAMNPRDLHEMSIFIRKVLKDSFGVFADGIKILYGGTADKVNAESLVRDGNVSGLLVGRESLKVKDFIELINSVDSIK